MSMTVLALASAVMRIAHARTRPPCNGRSATLERCTT
jgi:hypothetical protein